eukprot:6210569-Pleurochrysis_carterae.AAC.2
MRRAWRGIWAINDMKGAATTKLTVRSACRISLTLLKTSSQPDHASPAFKSLVVDTLNAFLLLSVLLLLQYQERSKRSVSTRKQAKSSDCPSNDWQLREVAILAASADSVYSEIDVDTSWPRNLTMTLPKKLLRTIARRITTVKWSEAFKIMRSFKFTTIKNL